LPDNIPVTPSLTNISCLMISLAFLLTGAEGMTATTAARKPHSLLYKM
jgi:hypothetical protein